MVLQQYQYVKHFITLNVALWPPKDFCQNSLTFSFWGSSLYVQTDDNLKEDDNHKNKDDLGKGES